MSKILFTHSFFYRFDAKQWKFKQPYPPLGTILAAAVMRQCGFEVQLFDTNLLHSPDEIVPVLQKEKPKYLVIYDDGFNYLSKMCLTNMRQAAFRLCELGHAFGCKVIVCNSDATDHYEKYLAHHAHFVIPGEGEVSLRELIQYLETGQTHYHTIEGIIYVQDEKIIQTPKRNILKNLDLLPMPAWDLVHMDQYREIWIKHHGYFSLNIATTRGCPFKCNWCAKPIYGNRYHSRSPEKVTEEIAFLLHTYKPDHFWMCDDIFGLKKGWVQEFNRMVHERKLHFTYKIQSRVDLLLEEDTIDALSASGLETAWVGAESGSQKILDAMDKGTSVEQIYKATQLLKKKRIRVGFFLQFGYPSETRKDIESTLHMLKKLTPDDIGISISYPLPGTVFYENVKRDLQDKTNWTDSDEMAMLFQGTYSAAYYKKLYQYVHRFYRQYKGLENLKLMLQHPLGIKKRQLRSVLGVFYHMPQLVWDAYCLHKLERL